MAHDSDIRRAAASILICGFSGPQIDAGIREMLAAGAGGVILFKRNIETIEQVADLTFQLQSLRTENAPLLVSIDQEGGPVARLREPVTRFPDMAHLGRLNDSALAWQMGRALALELSALGFNLDFAPVVDVDSNPQNPVIGARSFSSQPQIVGRLGAAVIAGLQQHGVFACAKHFPGHGDTSTDSHFELPVLHHDLKRLRDVELPPFAAAIEAGVATIMTAHILFPALDPALPATLSPTLLSLLRKDLNFSGLIISDDLEMKAVLDHFGVEQSIRQGLLAGVDAFLLCHQSDRQQLALDTLIREAEASSIFRSRLFEASHRVGNLRAKLNSVKPVNATLLQQSIGRPEFRELAQLIQQRGAIPCT